MRYIPATALVFIAASSAMAQSYSVEFVSNGSAYGTAVEGISYRDANGHHYVPSLTTWPSSITFTFAQTRVMIGGFGFGVYGDSTVTQTLIGMSGTIQPVFHWNPEGTGQSAPPVVASRRAELMKLEGYFGPANTTISSNLAGTLHNTSFFWSDDVVELLPGGSAVPGTVVEFFTEIDASPPGATITYGNTGVGLGAPGDYWNMFPNPNGMGYSYVAWLPNIINVSCRDVFTPSLLIQGASVTAGQVLEKTLDWDVDRKVEIKFDIPQFDIFSYSSVPVVEVTRDPPWWNGATRIAGAGTAEYLQPGTVRDPVPQSYTDFEAEYGVEYTYTLKLVYSPLGLYGNATAVNAGPGTHEEDYVVGFDWTGTQGPGFIDLLDYSNGVLTFSAVNTNAGSYSFNLHVVYPQEGSSDPYEGAAYTVFPYTVTVFPSASLSITQVPAGPLLGVPYVTQLQASGGVPPYAWNINTGWGTFSGLSMDGDILLGGPTMFSTASPDLVVTVTDSAGSSVSYGFPNSALFGGSVGVEESYDIYSDTNLLSSSDPYWPDDGSFDYLLNGGGPGGGSGGGLAPDLGGDELPWKRAKTSIHLSNLGYVMDDLRDGGGGIVPRSRQGDMAWLFSGDPHTGGNPTTTTKERVVLDVEFKHLPNATVYYASSDPGAIAHFQSLYPQAKNLDEVYSQMTANGELERRCIEYIRLEENVSQSTASQLYQNLGNDKRFAMRQAAFWHYFAGVGERSGLQQVIVFLKKSKLSKYSGVYKNGAFILNYAQGLARIRGGWEHLESALIKQGHGIMAKGVRLEALTKTIQQRNPTSMLARPDVEYKLAVELTDDAANAIQMSKPRFRVSGKTVARVGGRALIVVGVALDVYEIATAEDKLKAIVTKGGGWAGAMAAGSIVAEVAAPLNGGGPIGTGFYVLAVIGAGIFGYWAGETAATYLYELIVNPPTTNLSQGFNELVGSGG
jgi:hypothetical protein